MKQSIDFGTMDMDKYLRVLRQMLGRDLVCSIIDEHGEKHWQSDLEGGDSLDRILARAGQMAFKDLPGIINDLCPENHLALIHPLDLEYAESDIYLVGLVPMDTAAFSRADRLQAWFSDVASFMTSHHNLTMENQTMVQELSQRYEELNLVYQTEEDVTGRADTGKSLDHVVRDITEFMEVNAAFLWLPDMGYWFFHFGRMAGFMEKEAWIREMVEKNFDAMKKTGGSSIVNKEDLLARSSSPSGDLLMVASPVLDSGRYPTGVIGCLRRQEGPDFVASDRKLMEVTARRVRKIVISDLDVLTGLPNRGGFENKLGMLLAGPPWIRERAVVCLFNIDQFKLLNDAYGMAAGDAVLKQAALVLRAQLRDQDFLARIKGDEFAVILMGRQEGNNSLEVLERIKKHIAQETYLFKDVFIRITVRIGLVPLSGSSREVSDLISKSEIAVEEAREDGGDRISVFKEGNPKLEEKQAQARTATQIETLVENRQFVLFCQPVIPLQGGRAHYEILIRLKDEKGKIIAPYMFLPAAERYNKMPFIDQWVIEETCKILKNAESFLNRHEITWAINLSGQSLQDKAFLDYFLPFLSQLKLPASWLNFEITETVAIRNFDKVIHVIEQIRSMGFSISLDDFGSGYSSFGYLKKLPIEFLKIDGLFVQNLHKDPLAQVMVKSIATISKHLKIKTIAEFVENQAILDLLTEWGIDYSQGYHTGKPFALMDAVDRIKKQDICGNS